jgi:Type I restriction modification DNA specificity domain/N-6 DNA Methylase
MTETLFGTDSVGYFFVSPEIIRFLVALTAPQPKEKVLDIHLNPEVLIPYMKTIVEQSMSDMDVKYLESQATPEEVAQAEFVYDVILCSPTFGNALRSPDGSGDPNEEFWLKWSINHLSTKGRLAIIVPTGLLSNYSQRAIREFLIADGGIEAIIELPSGWSQNTYPQASILYITRNNDPNRDVKMIRFTKAESIPWNSLASTVREGLLDETQLKTGIGLTIKRADLDKHRLDVKYYHLKQAEIIPPDPKVFKEWRLSELVRISSGERFSKEDFEENGTPFVQVRNVTTDGTLDLRQAQTLKPINALVSRGYSKPGDILLTTAGTIGKVALIDDSFTGKGVCIDTSLRRLEVLDKKQVLPEYLTIFLQTPLAQQQMKLLTTGSVIPVLASPNLSELIVYLPSLTKQREIISMFKDPAIEYDVKIKTSFYSETQAEVSLTPTTVQTPVKEEQELPKASWREIVQSQLPFPIARAYTLFTISEYQPGNMRLKTLIDLSESIVYYVYNVLVADQLRRLKLDDAEIREDIGSSFTSYSVSSRLDVIFRILNFVQKHSDIDLFIPELVNIDLGVCRAFQNNVRNEWSHTSSFPEHKCRQIIIKYLPQFEKLLQKLLFLREYNLLQVLHITIRNNRLQHHVISMMGNNSLFQPRIEELEKENILLADSSHIVLLAKARGYDFLDLHPFYLVHAWEQTGEYDHLCFFKQTVGSSPNQRLKVESTQGVGDTKTETDLGFIDLISS